jgi:hypothetical protein
LATGTEVEIGERKGIVERIGAVNTVLHKDDRTWLVPNAMLLENIVVQ